MNLEIDLDREDDGRRIAEVPSLPGILASGTTREESIARVKALASRVINNDRLSHGDDAPGRDFARNPAR